MSKDTPRGPGEILENVRDEDVAVTSPEVDETTTSTRGGIEAVMKKDMHVPRAANSETLLRLVAPVIDLDKYRRSRRVGKVQTPKLRAIRGGKSEVIPKGSLDARNERVASKKLLPIALVMQQELASMPQRTISTDRAVATVNLLIDLRNQDFFIYKDDATFFNETAKLLLRLFNRSWKIYLNDRCVRDMMYKIREDELTAPKMSLIASWIRGSS